MQGGEDAKGKECLGQTESGPSAAPSPKHGSERQGKPPRGSATRALRWRRVGSRFRPYHDLNSCDANGEPKQSRQSKQKPSGKVGILDGRTSDHDLEEECSWHTLGSMPPGGQFGRRWATCLAPGFCWLEPECPERPGCPGRPECKAASGQERLCKRIKPNQARTGLPCHPLPSRRRPHCMVARRLERQVDEPERRRRFRLSCDLSPACYGRAKQGA